MTKSPNDKIALGEIWDKIAQFPKIYLRVGATYTCALFTDQWLLIICKACFLIQLIWPRQLYILNCINNSLIPITLYPGFGLAK